MFTIIVCSISPEAAARLQQNVAQTIGVPFEFIAFDNRTAGRGICSVYSECARRAKFDLLCFVHEDVAFRTLDWGRVIAAKLREEDCGVVGFAGGAVKTRTVTGWCLDLHDTRRNYFQPDGRGGMKHNFTNPDGVDFAPVVCLDGFCLMTSRRVWEASPFDERLLTGFHAYDLDFTTAAACRFRNYTCNTVGVEHHSTGKYTTQWFDALKSYHEKWYDRLPMFAQERPSDARIMLYERRAEAYLIQKLLRQRLYARGEGIRAVARFVCRNPFDRLSCMLVYKYLRYTFFPTGV